MGDICHWRKGLFMELFMLSSRDYGDHSKNYGDCTVIIEDREVIIFDCGSEEHAYRVIKLLDKYNIDKAFVVLSHNDDDHFRGIETLIEHDRVDVVYTVLLLKYKDEILKRITDNRVTEKSAGKRIIEMYDNIASLKGKVKLLDAYIDKCELPLGARMVGPDKEYMLDVVAKGLDPLQGDTEDNESIKNATSIQIAIDIGDNSVLLVGDCPPDAIPEDVDFSDYKFIQLPHHGKPESAKKMFERADRNNGIIWIVSDNTGGSNGGSDNRAFKGHYCINTRTDGDIVVAEEHSYSRKSIGRLCK